MKNNNWFVCQLTAKKYNFTVLSKINVMAERYSVQNEKQLEVHGTMSQVVFSPEVGDLLGLHGLQLWTVCDTMTQTTTERTAPLSWKHKKQVC